ncbi:MAG TPA: MotA/TolQ/ExbB proton channel family protein [Deltaproteobacteria bacterium]|nr:MotA/TolQ/ExbB proton channel family protein [Deltaproteobacteria bacterium]
MDFALLRLLYDSDPIVLGVLGLLLLLSVLVWAAIFFKLQGLLRRRRRYRRFLKVFESTPQTEEMRVRAKTLPDNPLKVMFDIAVAEAARFRKSFPHAGAQRRTEFLELMERTLEAQIVLAEKELVGGQAMLATTSVVAPFIGLFGTVIGIINTFQGIAEQNSVDLAVISPGIAEALVATAAGLFTAIPATVAYNLFRSMILDLTESLDFFALQLIRRIQLQLIAHEEKRV